MITCSFGIILNIITLLIIFTLIVMFSWLYLKKITNNKGTYVNASTVFRSIINGDIPTKNITKLEDFSSYNWDEYKEPNKNGMLTVRSYPIT